MSTPTSTPTQQAPQGAPAPQGPSTPTGKQGAPTAPTGQPAPAPQGTPPGTPAPKLTPLGKPAEPPVTTPVKPGQAPPPPAESKSIDDLLTWELPEAPTDGKNLSYQELYNALPDGAYKQSLGKFLHDIRADYSKQGQTLAQERKALQEQRQAIQAEREALLNGKQTKANRELAAKEVDLDPMDPESVAEYIKVQQAKAYMEQVAEPLQQELQLVQRKQALETFKNEHPDLMTEGPVRTQTIELLGQKDEAGNHLYTLENAYYMALGRVAEKERYQRKLDEAETAKKNVEAFKSYGRRRVTTAAKPPKGANAVDVLRYYQNIANTAE